MIGPKTLVGFPFLILGLISAAAFATFSFRSLEIVWTGQSATGEVVRMEKVRGGYRAGRSYLPIVSFVDGEGSKRVFRQKPGGRKGAYAIGEKVGVLYLPADPDRAVIDSFWGRYGFIFATLFALGFVTLGGWLIRQDRREHAIFDR